LLRYKIRRFKEMKCLKFKIETVYLTNFRKTFSTITILSYPFPPYTTIRGLLANALGLGDLISNRDNYNEELANLKISLKLLNKPERFQDVVLMKKLKSPAGAKDRKKLLNKLRESNFNISILTEKERNFYEKLRTPESTSAPFVKELITPIECIIFLLGEESKLLEIRRVLNNPVRPLYIGSSDDFVIISRISDFLDVKETQSQEIDSIVKINEEVQPVDKKQIIGRIPYIFKVINKKKRDYSRIDWIIAVPEPGEKVRLNKAINCYEVENEYIAF